MTIRKIQLIAIAACATFFTPHVQGTEFITNGGFESGLANWTQAHNVIAFTPVTIYAGTNAPSGGYLIPGPRTGSLSALFDPAGPDGAILFQDFTAPLGGPGTLSFSMFVMNRHGSFINGAQNFGATVPGQINQMVRIDILNPAANAFSTQPGDIYATFYQSVPGDPLLTPYLDFRYDLTAVYAAHPGQALRLRFGTAVTEFYMQVGLDNISVTDQPSGVPEPGTWLAGLGAVGAVAGIWSRRRKTGLLPPRK